MWSLLELVRKPMKMTLQQGIVIRHRQISQYVCYDSFKSQWYWGSSKQSEIFGTIKAAAKLRALFPEGSLRCYGSIWKGTGFDKPSRILRYEPIDINNDWEKCTHEPVPSHLLPRP